MGAEQGEHPRGGDDAHGLAVKGEAVSAVIKPRAGQGFARVFQFAGDEVPFDGAEAEERLRRRDHPRTQKPECADEQRNGNALQIKPCPVGSFYAEKRIERRQGAAEEEGDGEKADGEKNIPLRARSAPRQKRQNAAERELHEVRRPDGKAHQRERDRERPARAGGCRKPQGAHLHARALQSEQQQEAVQHGVFKKGVLPIDDHILMTL